MAKETITQNEYLQLVGLKTLANKYNRLLEEIRLAGEAIVEEETGGHIMDNFYDVDESLDDVLKRLNITVEK